jgi:hypothetical protein
MASSGPTRDKYGACKYLQAFVIASVAVTLLINSGNF